MKIKILGISVLIAANTFIGSAQNIDRNDVKFDYIQLPLKPLEKSIKNAQTKANMAYASDVASQKLSHDEKIKKADADYQEALKDYEVRKKEAKTRYDGLMAEWNKKSLAERLLLKDKEPKMEYVSVPYKQNPVEEKYQKVFDDGLVASYVKLEGFKSAADNAAKITIKLLGFESSEPKKLNKSTNSVAMKGGATTTTTYYWCEVEYKHPVGYKVELPNGEVVLEDYPKDMAEFSTYKSPEYKSEGEFNSFWNSNKDATMQRLQNEIVEKNLKAVNALLNDDYGYRKMSRETELYMVSNKANDYPEYKEAYDDALEGFKGMTQDATKAASIEKIKKSIETWEKDMKESAPDDKKARIDFDVTVATLFNLIEAQSWVGDFTKASDNLSKLNRMDLSKKERRRYESLNTFVIAQRARFDANKA